MHSCSIVTGGEQRLLSIMGSVTLKMTLVFLLIVFCATFVNSQLFEGDACQLPRGESGICRALQKCTPVYNAVIAGKFPEKLCGYDNFVPIVCCSTTTTSTTTQRPTTTAGLIGDGRGEIARQKCKEYTKYVYLPEYSHTLIGGEKPLLNVSQCAIKAQQLIVGGEKADPKEFPHMAAVGFDKKEAGIGWLCGGTLISEKFVMTAAHCTYTPQWGVATWARVGDLNLIKSNDRADPQDRRIVKRMKHPDYKKPLMYHDIALLELEAPVKFTGYVRPACLYTSPTIEFRTATATGWGKVDWADDEGNNDLLKVALTLVPQPACNASYNTGSPDIQIRNGIIGEWQLCAGEKNKDTCQGDSGGPLVIVTRPKDCMYDVVGVTSLGRLCGGTTPGVYTRVYHYIPWIESVVWPQG